MAIAVKKTRKKKKLVCWKCHTELFNSDSTINYLCPHCNAEYSNKPINEAKLSILQDQYLLTRDNKVLDKMLTIMQGIVYNLICSKLKASGKYLEEEDILDKVQWTLWKMITYYKRDSFKISVSFIEYLSQVVLYPLYNYKTKNRDIKEISIFTPVGKEADGKEQTLLDKMQAETYLDGYFDVENYFFKNIEIENTVKLVKDYVKSVITIANEKKGFSSSLKMLILYNHYFNKRSDRFFSKWWEKEGFDFRDQWEKSLSLLREVLYESAKT